MGVFITQLEEVEIVYNSETNSIEEHFVESECFEITYVDSGKSFQMTLAESQQHFGVQEFDEIRQGFLPHIMCIQL